MTQARVVKSWVLIVSKRLERGERNPTAISLWQTAEALGVHVTALLDDSVTLRMTKIYRAKALVSSGTIPASDIFQRRNGSRPFQLQGNTGEA